MNNILNVGSTPIGIYDWTSFQKHKTSIVDYCLLNEKSSTIESDIAPEVKHNLWESDFNFLNRPELIELTKWITVTTKDFINSINHSNYHIAITDSWAHVTSTTGHHEPHRHTNASWSGLFYVQQGDIDSGKNIFFNYHTMPDIKGYEFYNEQFTIDIKPGRLVIFPSTMLHYAKPYLGTDKRIIISFNSICV
jgi:uncharacterized protein (TIGR02466 family)